MNEYILTITVFFPILGVLILLFTPKEKINAIKLDM